MQQAGTEHGKRRGSFSKHLAAAHSHGHHGDYGPDNQVRMGLTIITSSFSVDRDKRVLILWLDLQVEGQRRHQHSPASSSRSNYRKGDGKVDVSAVMTTSSELLKVLSRIRILEEQHNASLSLTGKLRAELEQAREDVQELERARREVDGVVKRMGEEKKVREQEMAASVQAAKEEVEEERKVRRRVELANRKMTKELVEANMATAKALQELESERKARQLMEDVCDELAREIGDDKQEREELKRESERVRDELEEERRMLQLAEVWREERVQMKLTEAKVALEEKSAALDVMRAELESFLRGSRDPNPSTLHEAQVLRNVITSMHPRGLVASFPPAALNQAASPDHDLYSMDIDDQTREGHYWGSNPLDSQDVGSRWEDSECDEEHIHAASHDSKEPLDSGSDFVSESDGDPESSHPVTTHASDPQDSVDEYAHTDEVATLHICRHYFGTRFETGILILVLAFVWTGHSGVEEWAPGGVEG
jgi:hypothetical protein